MAKQHVTGSDNVFCFVFDYMVHIFSDVSVAPLDEIACRVLCRMLLRKLVKFNLDFMQLFAVPC
jgi:hypothetical protein